MFAGIEAIGSERASGQRRSLTRPTGSFRDSAESRPGRARPGAVEGHAAVAQRHPGVVADHHVVEDVDVEQPPGGDRLGGEVEVVGARRRVAGRVVVAQDDAGGVEPDGVAEQLPHPHQRRGDVAHVDRRHALDDVLRVEAQHPELLALEAAHLEEQAVRDVARRPDRPAPGRPLRHRPPSQLERGRQARRLRDADARDRRELAVGGPGERRQARVPAEDVLGHLDRAPATRARPEHDGEELGRREPGGPAQGEPLAGPLGGRQVPHRPSGRRVDGSLAERVVGPSAVARPHRPPAASWRAGTVSRSRAATSEVSPGPDNGSPPISPAIRIREHDGAYAAALTRDFTAEATRAAA